MRILIPMACALLALAACGGGDSPTVETPTATAEPASETPGATLGAASPTPCQQTEYEVKDGDLLGAIADEFGVSVDAIAEASGIDDPDTLSIGQKLTIPCAEATPTPTEAADAGT